MINKFLALLAVTFSLLFIGCNKDEEPYKDEEPSGPPEVQFLNYTSFPELELNIDGAENVIVDSSSLSSYITLEAGISNFGVSEVDVSSNLALESKTLVDGKKYTLVAFQKSLSDTTDVGLRLLENVAPSDGYSNVRYIRFDFQNELNYGYPPSDLLPYLNTESNVIALQIDPNPTQSQLAPGYPETLTSVYGYDDAVRYTSQQPQAEVTSSGFSEEDGLWSSAWANIQQGTKYYWIYYFKEFSNSEMQRMSEMETLNYDLSFIQNTNQHHGIVLESSIPTHNFIAGESYTFFVYSGRLKVVQH